MLIKNGYVDLSNIKVDILAGSEIISLCCSPNKPVIQDSQFGYEGLFWTEDVRNIKKYCPIQNWPFHL